MNDSIIDDVFKSDKYSTSLNELLFSRSYKPNINSIKKLLDDNGYFGRYKIEPIYDKEFRADSAIKIHIYLVDSNYTYTWPYNTFFDLDTKVFAHNRKIPTGVFTNKSMFSYCFTVLSTMFTPVNMLEQPLTDYEDLCIECMDILKRDKNPISEWPWIICRTFENQSHRPYYDKIIPFLSRVGLIVNNRFIIIGEDDAEEYPANMFDINYWKNI